MITVKSVTPNKEANTYTVELGKGSKTVTLDELQEMLNSNKGLELPSNVKVVRGNIVGVDGMGFLDKSEIFPCNITKLGLTDAIVFDREAQTEDGHPGKKEHIKNYLKPQYNRHGLYMVNQNKVFNRFSAVDVGYTDDGEEFGVNQWQVVYTTGQDFDEKQADWSKPICFFGENTLDGQLLHFCPYMITNMTFDPERRNMPRVQWLKYGKGQDSIEVPRQQDQEDKWPYLDEFMLLYNEWYKKYWPEIRDFLKSHPKYKITTGNVWYVDKTHFGIYIEEIPDNNPKYEPDDPMDYNRKKYTCWRVYTEDENKQIQRNQMKSSLTEVNDTQTADSEVKTDISPDGHLLQLYVNPHTKFKDKVAYIPNYVNTLDKGSIDVPKELDSLTLVASGNLVHIASGFRRDKNNNTFYLQIEAPQVEHPERAADFMCAMTDLVPNRFALKSNKYGVNVAKFFNAWRELNLNLAGVTLAAETKKTNADKVYFQDLHTLCSNLKEDDYEILDKFFTTEFDWSVYKSTNRPKAKTFEKVVMSDAFKNHMQKMLKTTTKFDTKDVIKALGYISKEFEVTENPATLATNKLSHLLYLKEFYTPKELQTYLFGICLCINNSAPYALTLKEVFANSKYADKYADLTAKQMAVVKELSQNKDVFKTMLLAEALIKNAGNNGMMLRNSLNPEILKEL